MCFREFGDRVLFWTTLNEVNIAALGGYDRGIAPPGRCSTRSRCLTGDSTREPYLAVHNMLLSHSAAAKLYKGKYEVSFLNEFMTINQHITITSIRFRLN